MHKHHATFWMKKKTERITHTQHSQMWQKFDELISELDGGILGQQVDSLGLNVNIAWVGSHLRSFVQERTNNKLPTLFFNWMPNTVTALGNYTRVKFPLCQTSQQKPTNCDFQVNQLSKAAWVRKKNWYCQRDLGKFSWALFSTPISNLLPFLQQSHQIRTKARNPIMET